MKANKRKYVPKETTSLFELAGKPTFRRCCVCKKVMGVAYKGNPLVLNGKVMMYSDGYCPTCQKEMLKGVKKCP